MKTLLVACGVGLALASSSTAHALESSDLPFDLGDDSGLWPFDGECDDARFGGEAMPTAVHAGSIGADASDCSRAFINGAIEPNPLFLKPKRPHDIVWGDDEGVFPNDGECYDIRFTGQDTPHTFYLTRDIGHDASDCLSAFSRGAVRWRGEAQADQR